MFGLEQTFLIQGYTVREELEVAVICQQALPHCVMELLKALWVLWKLVSPDRRGSKELEHYPGQLSSRFSLSCHGKSHKQDETAAKSILEPTLSI